MRARYSLLFVFALLLTVFPLAPAAAQPPQPINAVGLVPAEPLQSELDAFTAKVGIPAFYEQVGWEELLERIDGENPPDVVIGIPFGDLFGISNHLVDLSQFVKAEKLRKSFGDHLVDLATTDDGMVLGAPVSIFLKTLVWYKPAEFAEYAIPETFDELVALSDQMLGDGETPWCNYIRSGESGEFTGWVGTDWIEDLLLGAEGSGVYDSWVDHNVLFTDPRIEEAFERYQGMIDTEGYVFDRQNMLNVDFSGNAEPLINGDCLMHRQATFFGGFLGEAFDEVSTFKFPSVDPRFTDAAVGGAEYVAALNDRKEVGKLIKFMVGPEFGRAALAPAGGWVLPHIRFDHSFYADEMVRSWAGIARAGIMADLLRFDGSDLMPGEVGAGTFWSGIVDLVEGSKTIPEVLDDIDASWPLRLVLPAWTTGEDVEAAGQVLADALNAAVVGNFRVELAGDPREMYELMCGIPGTSVGLVPTGIYGLASVDCGVDAAYKAYRFGNDSFWTQFLVPRDGEIDELRDLRKMTWAHTDRGSLSSYWVPLGMLSMAQVKPGEAIGVGTHHQAVRAVYNDDTGFATTFFSPPWVPVGEWEYGDPPDIPEAVVPTCGWESVNGGSGLFCGVDDEWRVLDARASSNLVDLPDIVQRVRILDISPPIPNDAVAFGARFSPELRLQVEEALADLVGTDMWDDSIGLLYQWQDIAPATDADWDWLRSVLDAAGFGIGD